MVACDPVMCAALQSHGVIGGRLVPLRPGSADPGSASVIASFGAGPTRIEVRVVTPGGAAAYESALRADLAARMDAGSQLLQNSRIQFIAQDGARLRAGEVDARLLATLAALSPVYSFRVTGFGDASPGAQVLFRDVTITMSGRGDGGSELAAARALVSSQATPYLPAHATIIAGTTGQSALRIEFAAPSPLGLLTKVLTAYSSA
jgi:hypothetical protein